MSEFLFIPFAPVNVNQWRRTSPTSAFVSGLVMVSVAVALGQTLSLVTDGSWVVTHVAVVRARAVARGAIRVAAHALLLLLAGKVPVRTVVHTLTSLEEVELVAVWAREKVQLRLGSQKQRELFKIGQISRCFDPRRCS